MLAQMQETIPIDVPSSLASSYAIGPIDPIHLHTLQARLSDGQDISLLVPTHLPLSVLNDPQFKDGCEWGYLSSDSEEGWTIPQMINYIYIILRTELWGECSLSTYAWVVGFLLGNLAGLAETERTLALVGIAHLRFLLACVALDAWSCHSYGTWMDMGALHTKTIRAYRARVRLYRGEGKSWPDAQRLALVGGELL